MYVVGFDKSRLQRVLCLPLLEDLLKGIEGCERQLLQLWDFRREPWRVRTVDHVGSEQEPGGVVDLVVAGTQKSEEKGSDCS